MFTTTKQPSLIDATQHEYENKYLPLFNNNEMVRNFDNTISRDLLTEEIGVSHDKLKKHCTDYSQANLFEFTKNIEKSAAARVDGNTALLNRNHNARVHEDAWKLYTKSVALAPPNSEELALAFGNRSFILMHIGQYRDSVKDIDRSLAITGSDALKLKLLCRKVTCCIALNDEDKQKSTMEEIQILFDSMDSTLKDEKLVSMVERAKSALKNPSLNDPARHENISFDEAENLTELKDDGENGKYLVASQDIQPGKVVTTLKPFVATPNPNTFYAYCSHCLSFSWSSIPCSHCRLCMFCSETCKDEALEEYHIIECSIILHMQMDLVMYSYYQLAVRSLIKGVKKAGDINKLLEFLEEFDKSKDKNRMDAFGNQIHGIEEFMRFYDLPINISLKSFIQLLKNTSFILNLLIQFTDMTDNSAKFKTGKELMKDEKVMNIALLVLKLTTIAASNIWHITVSKFGFFFRENKQARQMKMKIACAECSCKACTKNWLDLTALGIQHRQNPQSPEHALMPTMIDKYRIIVNHVHDANYKPNANLLEDLSRDINLAFQLSGGRPSYMACLLMNVLMIALTQLYGKASYDVSGTCF